jgi:hypothetical protein
MPSRRNTFWHPSLLLVFLLAAISGLALADRQNHVGFSLLDTALAAFAISGTMVALILPAAGLVGQLVTRQGEYWLHRIYGDDSVQAEEKQKVAKAGVEILKEARARSREAQRGSAYVACAFAFSCGAIILPRLKMCCYVIFADCFSLGLALGFLLVGAYWFLPPSLWIYESKSLDDAIRVIELEADAQSTIGGDDSGAQGDDSRGDAK